MLSNHQLFPLWILAVLSALVFVAFYFSSRKVAIWLLFITASGCALYAATLDPFLWTWDEQFHALVAKNMAANPLVPKLYAHPLLSYDRFAWYENYIWLHKQPLFLWQMAASIKLFGNTVFAVRFPSIIMHGLSTVMVYQVGKTLRNAETGLYAGFLFAVNGYTIQLISGAYSTDHNDITFLFYVIASIWSWVNYQQTKKKPWLILTGLFSGCAILVKWLTGLLIYAIWFSRIGSENRKEWLRLRNYYPLLLSLAITLLVVLPWQIYTWISFPAEAASEFNLNSSHFTSVVEGHGGNHWFHFRAINELYGKGVLVPYVLLAGFLLLVLRISRKYRLPLIVGALLPYLFFSMAQTKMISFTIIAFPFGFLALGNLLSEIVHFFRNLIKWKSIVNVFAIAGLLFAGYLLIDIGLIREKHGYFGPDGRNDCYGRLRQLEFDRQVGQELKGDNWVVFNSNIRFAGNIELMYFTDVTAYGHLPFPEELEKLRKAGYKVAIRDDGKLPDYILNDPQIRKITANK